jgi:hypothetical protein
VEPSEQGGTIIWWLSTSRAATSLPDGPAPHEHPDREHELHPGAPKHSCVLRPSAFWEERALFGG